MFAVGEDLELNHCNLFCSSGRSCAHFRAVLVKPYISSSETRNQIYVDLNYIDP